MEEEQKPIEILEIEKIVGGNVRYGLNKEGFFDYLVIDFNTKIINIDFLIEKPAFKALKSLYLSFNDNMENMSFINYFPELMTLFFETNFERKNLFDGIKQNEKLITLVISGNGIVNLEKLALFPNLYQLIADKNNINNLDYLFNLKNIKSLDLSDNKIIKIPSLLHLKEADFSNNLIEEITVEFLEKFADKIVYIEDSDYDNEFNFYNNPLKYPTPEVILGGKESILKYVENIKRGSKPLQEAKMVLIGEPESGKTSLTNYLLRKPFGIASTTKGVNLEQLKLTENNDTYRINLWDFGGQEIQTLVHQFFLTEDTLYVVVLNARQDAQFVDKYFEQIKSYAPNSPVVVVINRMDENPAAKIDEKRIREKYKNDKGEPILRAVHKVSLLKGYQEGQQNYQTSLLALEETLRNELLSLPTINKIVPQSYFDVKIHLESAYFQNIPYISRDTFNQICKEKNVTDDAYDELLKYLDILGTVRFFDDLETRHLQILNPEWLTDGVYRILTHERTHQLRGIITERDLDIILQKTEEGQFEYPKHHYHYLIEMIKRFSLGYYEVETKRIFIPKAFAEDYPDALRPDVFKSEAIHFFFKYETFIPSPIISGFIARMFGYAKSNLYWEKGIVLEKEEMGEKQTAFVEQDTTANRIDIWVQGNHRREFFIEIRKVFREFHQKRIGLVVDEMVVLDNRTKTSVKYKVLIANKLNRNNTYIDEEGMPHQIDRVLGLFETSSETNYYTIHQYGGNSFFGGRHEITIIESISSETQQHLEDLKNMLSESNKALVESLIEGLKEVQQSATKEKAKTNFEKCKEAIKNLPKIATEEVIKESTKRAFAGAYSSLSDLAQNLNAHDIVDFIAKHSILL